MPYTRPPLSKELLTTVAASVADHLLPAQVEATWLLGERATGIERDARRLELAGGEPLAYDRLVIATGCRARRWSGPGAELGRAPCDPPRGGRARASRGARARPTRGDRRRRVHRLRGRLVGPERSGSRSRCSTSPRPRCPRSGRCSASAARRCIARTEWTSASVVGIAALHGEQRSRPCRRAR